MIAGASGVIGTAAVERACAAGWSVTGLSRRRPVVAEWCRFRHLSVDLHDAAACRTAVSALQAVTDFVYAAVSEAEGLASGWRDPARIADNSAMFANLLAPLSEQGALRHVSLLQGAKAYGAHVHPVTVPLRENGPRDSHPNFYWEHEDLLRATAAREGFDFTVFRPQVLLGWAPGAAMNPVAAIGAYAALCGELALPFALPGESEALWEMVDAELLAEAMLWAATEPQAAGETFNVTNGDIFVLRHAWTDLGGVIGLDTGGAAPETFSGFLASKAARDAWSNIAARHDLAEPSLAALLGQSDRYLDLLLSPRISAKAAPVLLSTIKLRQAGFPGCRDSFASLVHQIRRMIELKLLPPLF